MGRFSLNTVQGDPKRRADDNQMLNYGSKSSSPFLGRELASAREYSDHTATAIDKAVANIVKKAYDRAIGLLRSNMDAVHSLADALLEQEEIDARIHVPFGCRVVGQRELVDEPRVKHVGRQDDEPACRHSARQRSSSARSR